MPAWLVAEMVVFNLARWLKAEWRRWFQRGANGVGISALLNFGYFVIVSAVPLLSARTPIFVTPHIWAGGTVAAILSNAALLAVAIRLAGGEALAFPAFEVLGACTGAEVLGFMLVWAAMVPSFRPTLWKRRTLRDHVRLTLWDGGTYTGRHGFSPDDSKAQVLRVFARRYWPEKALVTAWLQEHWATWTDKATRPSWFTKKFRRLFPPDWLPTQLDLPRLTSSDQLRLTLRQMNRRVSHLSPSKKSAKSGKDKKKCQKWRAFRRMPLSTTDDAK